MVRKLPYMICYCDISCALPTHRIGELFKYFPSANITAWVEGEERL